MAISRLLVEKFRNLTAVDLDFDPCFNFLIGNNGSGKTSLLEAIFILVTDVHLKVRSQIASFLTTNRTLPYLDKSKKANINGLSAYKNCVKATP